jgi:hypothetical protein
MSIINDALKKAQQNISTNHDPDSSGTDGEIHHSVHPATPSNNRRAPSLRLLLIIIALMLITAMLTIFFPEIQQFIRLTHQSNADNKHTINRVSAPSFRLNGIMISRDQPVALINNNLFHIGDHVEGYALVGISKSEISVEKNGQRFTVSLKN